MLYPFLSVVVLKMHRVYWRCAAALLLLLYGVEPVWAQKEANNWLLAPKTGITFKSGGPEKMEDVDPNVGNISSVISDVDGNLLFYTDGQTVWDRGHQPMPHGQNL